MAGAQIRKAGVEMAERRAESTAQSSRAREERGLMHGVKQPGEEEPEEERLNRESRGEDTHWVSREMRQGTKHHPVNSSRQSTLPPEDSEREQGAGEQRESREGCHLPRGVSMRRWRPASLHLLPPPPPLLLLYPPPSPFKFRNWCGVKFHLL